MLIFIFAMLYIKWVFDTFRKAKEESFREALSYENLYKAALFDSWMDAFKNVEQDIVSKLPRRSHVLGNRKSKSVPK